VAGVHAAWHVLADAAAILAMAAETYLHATDAANYVEQHVTGSDGTRYVVTFQRPDGSSADELRAAAEAALAKLTTAHVAPHPVDLDVGLIKTVGRRASGGRTGRYFADRTDGLRPSTGEDFVVAIT
jgi:hypothetical protein